MISPTTFRNNETNEQITEMNDNINMISLYHDFNELKHKQEQTYATINNNEDILNNNNDDDESDSDNDDEDLFIVFYLLNIR